MVDAGQLYKVDRGLYSFDEYWEDDLYEMCIRDRIPKDRQETDTEIQHSSLR